MRALLLLCLFLLSSCAGQSGGRRGLFDYSDASPTAADLGEMAEQGGQCRAITAADREKVLAIAHPENFPKTRYRTGSRRAIETETDCSHFVHEIYRRAGLPFSFRPTRELADAPEFELLPESKARPGDLMLFRGHVGILDRDGKVISATKNRGRRGSITRLHKDAFRHSRSAKTVLRYRCGKVRQIAQEPSRHE